MIIGVTPILHTIRGLEQFTYRTPADLKTHLGQVVVMPWRTRQIYGVVTALNNVEPLAQAKLIMATTRVVVGERYLRYLRWFANFYGISLSHTFKISLPPMTQRAASQSYSSTSASTTTQALLPLGGAHTMVCARWPDVQRVVKKIVRELKGQPCAMIVPTELAVTRWQTILKTYAPAVVTAKVGRKQLWQVWRAMHCGQSGLYLGTKRLSLLPLTEMKRIIVVFPEDSAQKQWDLNPRYHVQRLTAELADHYAVPVTYISYAPRLEQYAHHTINTERLRHVRLAKMRFISLEQQPALTLQVQERMQQAAVPVLWYQRKGKHRFLICRNCASVQTHTELERCPNCNSLELGMRSLGTTALVEELHRLFPARPIVEITREHKPTAIPYQQHPIIVTTSAGRDAIDWSIVDYAAVVLIDHILGLPYFRAHELAYQQLVWLRNQVLRLDVQTYVPTHPVLLAATQRWPEHWYAQTWQQRQQFYYPPAGEYIIVRHTKTKAQRVIRTMAEVPTDPAWIIDREL